MQTKRYISLFLVFFIIFLTSCTASPSVLEGDKPIYDDYRQIPGVTADEIAAIEALKSEDITFVYGMNYTTETFLDQSGVIQGFSHHFCDLLTDLFDIPFYPAIYEWEDLIAGLDNNLISFTGELTKTPERLEKYYMTDPIAERTVQMFILKDSLPITETAKSRTPQYGFLEGTVTIDQVRSVSSLPFDLIYIENYEQAASMLHNGTLDVFFDDGPAEAAFADFFDIDSETFLPVIYSPVSFSTTQKRLEPIITVMQKYLDYDALQFLIPMYNESMHEYARYKFRTSLTTAELAYLNSHIFGDIPIPTAVEYDNYPMSFYNKKEEAWQGSALDVLKNIEYLTGLRFEYSNASDTEWHDLLTMLELGQVSVITELIMTDDRKDRFLWPDDPYMIDYYALLSTYDYEDITFNQILYSKVGLLYDTAYENAFHELFPTHSNTVVYNTTDEAFVGLESGEVDLLLGTRNVLLSETNYMEKPGFKVNMILDKPCASYLGFSSDQTELCSIISKAQKYIDTAAISDRWVRKVFDYRTKLEQSRALLYIAGMLLIAAILIFVIFILMHNRKMNKKLEETVHERTAELEIQTQMAQVASQAKGAFLARMSHEIRTPLNAVIGMAHIAAKSAKTGDTEKQVSSIERIITASSHLLGILNDVLDMAKIESGKFTLAYEAFPFMSAMNQVESIIAQRCEEKGITLHTNLRDVPNIAVFGDRLRLTQILINLLGNSVKFTDSGSITFTVTVKNDINNKNILCFMISDTGIGISEEQIGKLFVPFEQADNSIAQRFGGTGLGLAISQNLVEQMGGKIVVESVLGQGSSFSFSLLLPSADLENLDSSRGIQEISLNLSGKHILLAEDVEVNRIILTELLTDTHVIIEEARDGAEAVSMFENSPAGYYDLIFMDIQMPNVNGYEACHQIRAMEREDAGRIPIIAMTANAYQEDIMHAVSAGMNGHLAKPLDLTEVQRVLNEIL